MSADAILPSLRLIKALGDETRLRALAVLSTAEFTVSELVAILGIHQSSASRCLSQLREAGLLDDRREGAVGYYRLSDRFRASPELGAMVRALTEELPDASSLRAKAEERLELRRKRSAEFFDRVAGSYRGLVEPGGSAQAVEIAFASLVRADLAVDLGCGEGELAAALARGCRRVVAVDVSARMLRLTRSRCARERLSNVLCRKGSAESVPLGDGSADLVLASQVLHHCARPEQAVREMGRVLRPGGRFALLDLLAHDQEWVRERLGDQWLGFRPEQIAGWASAAGLEISARTVFPVENGLPVLLVIGERQ